MSKSKKSTTKKMALPVSGAARELCEEVKVAGSHGTLTNTIEVSLRTHLRLLRGELVPSRQPVAGSVQ